MHPRGQIILNPEAKDYLALFAEISVAVVALSGIIMVLAVSGRKIPRQRVVHIATQLRIALIVTIFSLLPLLMTNFNLAEESIWRVASGAYIVFMAYIGFRLSQGAGMYGSLPGAARVTGTAVGLCGVVLMPFNVWLGQPWPYLVQLMLALILSILLFLDFVYQVLGENSEDG